jgi:hypothetical protein
MTAVAAQQGHAGGQCRLEVYIIITVMASRKIEKPQKSSLKNPPRKDSN